MKHMIAWTEFNRDRGGGGEMRHAEPKDMTKQEVLDAVSEWYDAIGTGLNDFEGIQLFRLKREEGGAK